MKTFELIDILFQKLGIDVVFGVPGYQIMPIWQNISKAKIILCSHEQEASYAAVGYAKKSRKPVAVLTIGSPGVTNCISGIAYSNIDSIPLIYISGRTSIKKTDCGMLQEESIVNRRFDSTSILNHITKKSVCISNPLTAAEQIISTMEMAVQHRYGAVHISIPIDIQNADIPVNNKRLHSPIMLSSYLEEMIPITKRPIIVIGWGAWIADAYNEIYRLAEIINAPVLVTSKAYCCIESQNPFYLGKLGYGHNFEIDSFVESYSPDSIISFGATLSDKDISNTILQKYLSEIPIYVVTDEPVKYHRNEIHYITMDMKTYLNKLLSMTKKHINNSQLKAKIHISRNKYRLYWREKIESSDVLAQAIWIISNTDSIITADAGNHLLNAAVLLEPKKCGYFFLDTGLRAMGTGICSAVGMALADRSNHYIAITGDGCMLMNGNVMHIAFVNKLPITFVVFNNHALGRVRIGQTIMNDYRGSDINNVDFMLYGKALGMQSYCFSSLIEFESQLHKIIHSNRPSLIEIITPSDEVPIKIKGSVY